MEILTVPGNRGSAWIKDAYAIFKRAPWVWIGMMVVTFVLFGIAMAVPLVGNVAMSLLQPVFTAGLMVACRDSDQGQPVTLEHLFAGFKNRMGPLITLGTLNLLMSAIVLGVTFLGGAAGLWSKWDAIKDGTLAQNPAELISTLITFSVVLTVGAVGFLLVTFATWFAPALIILKGLNAVESIKASFLGCIRNVWPLTMYSLWLLLWAVLASIPLGLGWIVLLPVLVITEYTGFRDIFQGAKQELL